MDRGRREGGVGVGASRPPELRPTSPSHQCFWIQGQEGSQVPHGS